MGVESMGVKETDRRGGGINNRNQEKRVKIKPKRKILGKIVVVESRGTGRKGSKRKKLKKMSGQMKWFDRRICRCRWNQRKEENITKKG